MIAVTPSAADVCPFFALISASFSVAQQPSSQLKQADFDYRAGAAALAQNDLNTALEDFQNVVRLAPGAEQAIVRWVLSGAYRPHR